MHHTLLYLLPCLHLGEALNIDPRQFYVQLYEALLQLDTGIYLPAAYFHLLGALLLLSVSSNDDVILALDCMDKMMRKRRQVIRRCAPVIVS